MKLSYSTKTTLTIALLSVASLALTLTRSADETPAGDGTAGQITGLMRSGAQKLSTISVAGISAELLVSPAAQTLIKNQTFDVADTTFQFANFQKGIEAEATWMMGAYGSVIGASKIKSFYFVIDDFDARRGSTICETLLNSRIMTCDFRRLHKLLLGYSTYRLPMTMIHEFTHLNQYANAAYAAIPITASPIGKLRSSDREFKAVAVEMAGLAQKYGLKDATSNYIMMIAGQGCTAALIAETDESKITAVGRRCQIGIVPWLIYQKTLTSPLESDPQALLIRLAVQVSGSTSSGLQAYTKAFADLQMQYDGAPFTLARMRELSAGMFIAKPAP